MARKLTAVADPPATEPPTDAEVRAARLVIVRAELAALEELAALKQKLDALRNGETA